MTKGDGINIAALGAILNGDIDNFLVASTPGGIEKQEANGQRQLVTNEWLPKEFSGEYGKNKDSRVHLEKLGIEIVGDADDIFYSVVLPSGWSKRATEHSMWSDLLDDKGRKRAAIFYKAAFYDRSAHISLCRRYNYSVMPVGGWNSGADYKTEANVCVVTDCDKEIARSEPLAPSDSIKAYDLRMHLEVFGKKYLEEHYPQYLDVYAYWD